MEDLEKLKIQPRDPQNTATLGRQQLNISQFTFSQTMATPLNTGVMHVTGSQWPPTICKTQPYNRARGGLTL